MNDNDSHRLTYRTIRQKILGMDGPFNTVDLFYVLEKDHGIRDRDLILNVLEDLFEIDAVRYDETGDGNWAFTVIGGPAVRPQEERRTEARSEDLLRLFVPTGTAEEMDMFRALLEKKRLSEEDLRIILRAIKLKPDVSLGEFVRDRF